MEPGLAARAPGHQDLRRPSASTTRRRRSAADTRPLGFHASVRAATGSWYIDPYYHLDTSVYVSYYGRDLVDNPHGTFVENGVAGQPRPARRRPQRPGRAGDGDRPAADLPARAGHRPVVRHLLRRRGNVTAGKVTLMNRVDQVYEDESAIRMVLIADNDKLNLNTAALGDRAPTARAARRRATRRRSSRPAAARR